MVALTLIWWGRLYEELYEKVRCFDAANTPWLCAWSDHIISRCPMPQVVGLWLLGVYALFVLVFPFVMLAFPLHDGYEAYPLTSTRSPSHYPSCHSSSSSSPPRSFTRTPQFCWQNGYSV